MSDNLLLITYVLLCIPPFVVVLIDTIDRIKYKNLSCVRVSYLLTIVCFGAALLGLFAAISNFDLQKIYDKSMNWNDLGFIVIMMTCYVTMTIILIIMHNERIIYKLDNGQIFLSIKAYKKHINIREITRIYLSNEYLDIYVNNERIRYGNNFLVGASEFESFVKNGKYDL